MVPATNQKGSRGSLLLKVAFQAECLIPLHQHLLVHRAVDGVAGGATLANRLMLEDEWPALRNVALGAGISFPRMGQG
jgi:hypothetical protein